ncbi:hypothetical protein ACIXIO_07550 [Bacteroides fragilis]
MNNKINLKKMAKKYIFWILLLMITISVNSAERINEHGVPTLDELAGDWIDVSTLRNFPALTNFIGGLQSTQNITAFQQFTTPPFAQAENARVDWARDLTSERLICDTMPSWSCELRLNGTSILASMSKWLPYEIERKTEINNIVIHSALRMPFEQEGVLLQIILENRSMTQQDVPLSMVTYGRVRCYASNEWATWGLERLNDNNFVVEQLFDGKEIVITDQSSPTAVAYSFVNLPNRVVLDGDRGEVYWNIRLAPGEKTKIDLVYAVENQKERAIAKARRWSSDFDKQFKQAKDLWEERWQAAFIPGNKYFSGHYPTLETDDPKISQVYYKGALMPLLLCRTNLPLSPRFFVTAGPRWANTIAYFWDVEMWANTWAMLEPRTMKEQINRWFMIDFHNCYAIDGYSGKGAGPWYAANDWSIFRCIEAYLGVTGDIDFLNQKIKSKTLLQHLEDLATYFESRPLLQGSMLADYGGASNLLECSPSYIQGVPSLNAANVYMLRKTAYYYGRMGNFTKQKELEIKAKKLLSHVLDLYESGEGVWNAKNKEGKKVPVRHCYDYVTIGQALEFDLKEKMKKEMNRFVESELLTKNWMRAMSLKDPAAAMSDRPDHGPMGSYSGWPPMTMDVMCRFGDFDKAIEFLRATEAITHEGSWAQSHEFVHIEGEKEPIVRAASRGGQDALEGCGTAFMEVIIRAFFGFRPDLSTDEPKLLSPEIPRGFNGGLKHIPWHNKLYTVRSGTDGLIVEVE